MTNTIAQEATGVQTLPESWEWARVEQIGDVVTGNTPSTKQQEYYGGSVPLFKPTDLNAGYWVSEANTTLTEEGAEQARVLPPKSILVTCIGATIGKTGLLQVEGATNQQINALVPSKGRVVSEYLYFAFISCLLQDQVLSNASSTTLPILNKSKFGQLRIPLPPLNEQRRIVEKTEELFTKLDAGVRSLEQARAQLKSYRRSVLKAAVEGELSREWREANKNELEPASELLERILQERREKFAGKKYKEPTSPDMSELSKLPNKWKWVSLEQLSWDSGYGTSSKCDYIFSGPPVLRIPNISRAKVDLKDIKFADSEAKLKDEGKVAVGDLLIIRTNGSKDLIGRAAVVRQGLETDYFFASYLIRYRLAGGDQLSRWMETIWHSQGIRSWMQSTAATSAGQYNISVGALNKLPLPLPPKEEIEVISEEVERRLSVVDKLEETVEASLKQANALRQSILKRAFSGELVLQDPDDEPAVVLLERIRLERQKTGSGRRARRTKVDDGGQERLI